MTNNNIIRNGTKDEEMVLKKGDQVLYGKYSGTELEVEGLVVEELVEQGPHRQALLAEGLALDERYLLHLVGGGGTQLAQLLLRLGDLPDGDFGGVVKLFQ